MTTETHPAGTVRHYSKERDEWIITSPKNALYSTALMLATEYWRVTDEKWLPILGEDGDDE